MKSVLLIAAAAIFITSCKSNNSNNIAAPEAAIATKLRSLSASLQQVPHVQDIPFLEDQKKYTVTPVVTGLTNAWGMCWLPDGTLLYTEKEGALFRFDGNTSYAIAGVPKVYTRGQGGLLDVTVHPRFNENSFIYLSYASPAGDDQGGNTAVARAVLRNDSLIDLKVLYKAVPNTKKGVHFGSRFAWDREGYLYFTMGERGERDINPQDITRDNGKIYRIHDDGRIPVDNPFVNVKGAKTAIYTYGNRNPQGMTVHPVTGEIIAHEHGPEGGDEINIIQAGVNYGWPVISYGEEYGGGVFAESTQKEGMAQPFYYWVPSIAPSGFAIIDNADYGDWNGNYLVGSLKFQYLEMLTVNDTGVVKREKLVENIGRLRDVKISPKGIIHISVEGKGIYTITPKKG